MRAEGGWNYHSEMQKKSGIDRIVLPDGMIILESSRCRFTFRRIRAGALLVTISGVDDGQFGRMCLEEIEVHLLAHRPLELFVDAEAAIAVVVEVSREWTHFFSANRDKLKRVSVLAGTRAVELTVAIAQHLSQTGNLIQIYTDRSLFEARLSAT
jgi:hypothetical protein